MLIVPIYLNGAKPIGCILIRNDGTSKDPALGNYIVELLGEKGPHPVVWRSARLMDHDRSESVYELVRQALVVALESLDGELPDASQTSEKDLAIYTRVLESWGDSFSPVAQAAVDQQERGHRH